MKNFTLFIGLLLLLAFSPNAQAQFSNSNFSGPWIIVNNGGGSDPEHMYLNFDGNGAVTHVGNAIDTPWVGTYSIMTNGDYSMDIGGIILEGTLSSADEGSCTIYANGDTMVSDNFVRVSDISAAGGRWTGTLTSEDSTQAPITFTIDIDANGSAGHLQGLAGPLSGFYYTEDGLFTGYIHTGDTMYSPMLFSGTMVGSTSSGMYNTYCNNCEDGTFTMSKTGVFVSPDVSNINQIAVYPNPLTESSVLEFDIKETADFNVSIISSTGQLISDKNMGTLYPGIYVQPLTELSSGITSGIYFVRLSSEASQKTIPVMVR